jgi:hypothetical protein
MSCKLAWNLVFTHDNDDDDDDDDDDVGGSSW